MSTRLLPRRALLLAALATPVVGVVLDDSAEAQDAKVTLKGRLQGGQDLLNPVWNEAADPKNHRYSFRQRSPTVGDHAKKLTAYLPKELAIVAMGAGAATTTTPRQIHVSGGRTSPVTVVIPEGQNVQFVNADPFPHKLYSPGDVKEGLGPEETKAQAQRVWKPPKAGVYEIRDEFFPSIRSWVVVEARAVASTYPNAKGEFTLPPLVPGEYELVAYFAGKPIGTPLKVDLKPGPETKEWPDPLVIGAAAEGPDDKDKDKDKDDKDKDKDKEEKDKKE